MEHFTAAVQQYANFEGRNTRTQYWMFVLFFMIFYTGCAVIDYMLGMKYITALYSFVLLLPSVAAGARRLHDTGRSGWWQLLSLIPLLGHIALIVLLVLDSEEGENAYGPNPKQPA